MEAQATLKFLRMSPQKVRLVADLIRGDQLDSALHTLMFLRKRAAKPMEALLRSAAANAGCKEGMDTESLFVSKVFVDEGPMMKRIMPRAMGRANVIQKRSSHIQITLQDRPAPATSEVIDESAAKEEKQGKAKKTTTPKKKTVVKKTAAKKNTPAVKAKAKKPTGEDTKTKAAKDSSKNSSAKKK